MRVFPTHHAVLYTYSNRQAEAEKLWSELRKLSVAHRYFNQTVLDIDTARTIISWANTPYNDDKTALISFHTASIPAQNAMLKILEEPNACVKFILVTSNKEHLLDTVLSRLYHVEKQLSNHEDVDDVGKNSATQFLSTPHTLRMKLPAIVKLLAEVDEEGRKDREQVRQFILLLSTSAGKQGIPPKYIKEIFECASYASGPSASGKALLEYLALLLPVIKV